MSWFARSVRANSKFDTALLFRGAPEFATEVARLVPPGRTRLRRDCFLTPLRATGHLSAPRSCPGLDSRGVWSERQSGGLCRGEKRSVRGLRTRKAGSIT